MTIADKLLQVNQVKQDIKAAIETKGIPMTNVAFTEYANKIADISGGGMDVYSMLISEGLDYYKVIAKGLYIAYDKDNLFESAWEHSLTVVTANKAQYPNGDTEGVIIPQGVTSISNEAFYWWTTNNQPLVIPNSVTSIGNEAFGKWDSNNQPLVIPNSVTSIGDKAFYWWTTNNQPLVIPNSVTSIGNEAFYWWTTNNQPLVIPNSVTSIGSAAFSWWEKVPYIVMEGSTPPTLSNANAFANQNNAPIYVPDSAVNAYKKATNWVSLARRIKSINEK